MKNVLALVDRPYRLSDHICLRQTVVIYPISIVLSGLHAGHRSELSAGHRSSREGGPNFVLKSADSHGHGESGSVSTKYQYEKICIAVYTPNFGYMDHVCPG